MLRPSASGPASEFLQLDRSRTKTHSSISHASAVGDHKIVAILSSMHDTAIQFDAQEKRKTGDRMGSGNPASMRKRAAGKKANLGRSAENGTSKAT